MEFLLRQKQLYSNNNNTNTNNSSTSNSNNNNNNTSRSNSPPSLYKGDGRRAAGYYSSNKNVNKFVHDTSAYRELSHSSSRHSTPHPYSPPSNDNHTNNNNNNNNNYNNSSSGTSSSYLPPSRGYPHHPHHGELSIQTNFTPYAATSHSPTSATTTAVPHTVNFPSTLPQEEPSVPSPAPPPAATVAAPVSTVIPLATPLAAVVKEEKKEVKPTPPVTNNILRAQAALLELHRTFSSFFGTYSKDDGGGKRLPTFIRDDPQTIVSPSSPSEDPALATSFILNPMENPLWVMLDLEDLRDALEAEAGGGGGRSDEEEEYYYYASRQQQKGSPGNAPQGTENNANLSLSCSGNHSLSGSNTTYVLHPRTTSAGHSNDTVHHDGHSIETPSMEKFEGEEEEDDFLRSSTSEYSTPGSSGCHTRTSSAVTGPNSPNNGPLKKKRRKKVGERKGRTPRGPQGGSEESVDSTFNSSNSSALLLLRESQRQWKDTELHHHYVKLSKVSYFKRKTAARMVHLRQQIRRVSELLAFREKHPFIAKTNHLLFFLDNEELPGTLEDNEGEGGARVTPDQRSHRNSSPTQWGAADNNSFKTADSRSSSPFIYPSHRHLHRSSSRYHERDRSAQSSDYYVAQTLTTFEKIRLKKLIGDIALHMTALSVDIQLYYGVESVLSHHNKGVKKAVEDSLTSVPYVSYSSHDTGEEEEEMSSTTKSSRERRKKQQRGNKNRSNKKVKKSAEEEDYEDVEEGEEEEHVEPIKTKERSDIITGEGSSSNSVVFNQSNSNDSTTQSPHIIQLKVSTNTKVNVVRVNDNAAHSTRTPSPPHVQKSPAEAAFPVLHSSDRASPHNTHTHTRGKRRFQSSPMEESTTTASSSGSSSGSSVQESPDNKDPRRASPSGLVIDTNLTPSPHPNTTTTTTHDHPPSKSNRKPHLLKDEVTGQYMRRTTPKDPSHAPHRLEPHPHRHPSSSSTGATTTAKHASLTGSPLYSPLLQGSLSSLGAAMGGMGSPIPKAKEDKGSSSGNPTDDNNEEGEGGNETYLASPVCRTDRRLRVSSLSKPNTQNDGSHINDSDEKDASGRKSNKSLQNLNVVSVESVREYYSDYYDYNKEIDGNQETERSTTDDDDKAHQTPKAVDKEGEVALTMPSYLSGFLEPPPRSIAKEKPSRGRHPQEERDSSAAVPVARRRDPLATPTDTTATTSTVDTDITTSPQSQQSLGTGSDNKKMEQNSTNNNNNNSERKEKVKTSLMNENSLSELHLRPSVGISGDGSSVGGHGSNRKGLHDNNPALQFYQYIASMSDEDDQEEEEEDEEQEEEEGERERRQVSSQLASSEPDKSSEQRKEVDDDGEQQRIIKIIRNSFKRNKKQDPLHPSHDNNNNNNHNNNSAITHEDTLNSHNSGATSKRVSFRSERCRTPLPEDASAYPAVSKDTPQRPMSSLKGALSTGSSFSSKSISDPHHLLNNNNNNNKDGGGGAGPPSMSASPNSILIRSGSLGKLRHSGSITNPHPTHSDSYPQGASSTPKGDPLSSASLAEAPQRQSVSFTEDTFTNLEANNNNNNNNNNINNNSPVSSSLKNVLPPESRGTPHPPIPRSPPTSSDPLHPFSGLYRRGSPTLRYSTGSLESLEGGQKPSLGHPGHRSGTEGSTPPQQQSGSNDDSTSVLSPHTSFVKRPHRLEVPGSNTSNLKRSLGAVTPVGGVQTDGSPSSSRVGTPSPSNAPVPRLSGNNNNNNDNTNNNNHNNTISNYNTTFSSTGVSANNESYGGGGGGNRSYNGGGYQSYLEGSPLVSGTAPTKGEGTYLQLNNNNNNNNNYNNTNNSTSNSEANYIMTRQSGSTSFPPSQSGGDRSPVSELIQRQISMRKKSANNNNNNNNNINNLKHNNSSDHVSTCNSTDPHNNSGKYNNISADVLNKSNNGNHNNHSHNNDSSDHGSPKGGSQVDRGVMHQVQQQALYEPEHSSPLYPSRNAVATNNNNHNNHNHNQRHSPNRSPYVFVKDGSNNSNNNNNNNNNSHHNSPEANTNTLPRRKKRSSLTSKKGPIKRYYEIDRMRLQEYVQGLREVTALYEQGLLTSEEDFQQMGLMYAVPGVRELTTAEVKAFTKSLQHKTRYSSGSSSSPDHQEYPVVSWKAEGGGDGGPATAHVTSIIPPPPPEVSVVSDSHLKNSSKGSDNTTSSFTRPPLLLPLFPGGESQTVTASDFLAFKRLVDQKLSEVEKNLGEGIGYEGEMSPYGGEE